MRGVGGGDRRAARAAAQPERVTERAPVDEAQAAEDLRYARSLSRAFQHAAEHVEPSVVHITTRSDQLVRDFFGRVRERSSSGLGSGVIVSEDGYILTNNHVIKGAGEVLVKLADGRTVPGKVIGGDELRDIAVVRIEATGLTAARLGSDEPLEVGEWVLAVGSPFGFDQTVTAGIVSAMGRGLGIVSDEFKDAEQFIQTDAAINPGNSGGPLINLDGEVVGINSAIFSRTGGSVGLGFSIPIDLARAVYDNIIRGGRSDFGWLGVELGTGDEGVRVARVLDDSPAASAGLLVGDVIRRYQGREVADPTQLIRSIQFTPPGSEARFEVERSGRPFELTARVASRTQAELDRYDGRRVESLGLDGHHRLGGGAGHRHGHRPDRRVRGRGRGGRHRRPGRPAAGRPDHPDRRRVGAVGAGDRVAPHLGRARGADRHPARRDARVHDAPPIAGASAPPGSPGSPARSSARARSARRARRSPTHA